MICWIDSLSEWDSALPAALIVRGVAPSRRRALLRELAARALGIDPADVALEHRAQAAPRWLKPAGAGLFLSSASRQDWAVVAVAQAPIGVDVEAVDPESEVPWNVLHPTEAEALRPLQTVSRARAFARLWSVKESYVKALRVESREADSFAVRLREDGTALIDDPLDLARVAEVRTIWRSAGPCHAAVSAVVLDPPRTT